MVFAVLVVLAVPPQLALLLATILGIAFNYFTTGALVFGDAGPGGLWRFVVVYAACYALNALGLKHLTALGIGPLLAQLALMPFVVVGTYMSLRLCVFNRRQT